MLGGKRLDKAKKISKRLFKIYHRFDPRVETEGLTSEDDVKRLLGIYRKTRKPCSCWMCGSRRKYEGPTRQEKKQLIDDEPV